MKTEEKNGKIIKNSRFPPYVFATFYGVLFLMSGIHTGLIVGANEKNWNDLIQVILPIVYWGIVAAVLTLFTRRKIRTTYEEPMHRLAKATEQVANGDFSVYVPPLHTPDRMDYLDVMILDFNKMVEELGSIETLKTDFISNVSHEMKTPIAIIKNYGQMLAMETISEEERIEYAKTIQGAAERLSNLIGNILKLNKLENQSIIPEMEPYDLSRQLCDCILQFEEAWEEKEIEIDTDMEDSLRIWADEGLLELVWNNLISNAVKFTEPGGTIRVTQRSDGDRITVSVSDTGCGMSKDSLKHVFDKFYQGDTSRAKEGNGLGLALVKRVIELLDGDIQVTSQEGEGSTFTVTLPAGERGHHGEKENSYGRDRKKPKEFYRV